LSTKRKAKAKKTWATRAKSKQQRPLLATMTKEPFQPVRLYYSIPSQPFVLAKLQKLACVVEAPPERCWHWLFEAEAASIRFAGGYDDVPVEKRPIIIGRIRFPATGGMTFETNSIARAVEGARFFGPRLGPEVVAMRCRVVNRCFAGDEGRPSDLLGMLDRDVTVVEPRVAEHAFRREFAGVRTQQDAERVAAESLNRRLESGKDVPLVEDLPLAPEEETPDLQHLATTLQFRFVRAYEHWRGNTHLTLTAIIMRTVQQGMGARGGQQ
jgi:hypothetical protein